MPPSNVGNASGETTEHHALHHVSLYSALNDVPNIDRRTAILKKDSDRSSSDQYPHVVFHHLAIDIYSSLNFDTQGGTEWLTYSALSSHLPKVASSCFRIKKIVSE